MKKLLYLTAVAAVAVACSKKDDVPSVPSSWTSGKFGTVSFATTQTWTVGSQTWSDAVQTSYSNSKTIFKSNTADCRSNPDYKGDLFSWHAVDSFKNELCPKGWRVPTMQDFIDLDIALGGTGNYNPSADTTLRNKYLNTWGGVYGGYCDSFGSLGYQGSGVDYWSQSEESLYYAYTLYFDSDGFIHPQGISGKSSGRSLRCVRDN